MTGCAKKEGGKYTACAYTATARGFGGDVAAGIAVKADTVEGLAQALGMTPSVLAETVETYGGANNGWGLVSGYLCGKEIAAVLGHSN